MKLKDLKTGMVVQMANNQKYLVVNDYFINNIGHMPFNRYNENMENISGFRIFDIIKVWELRELTNLSSMLESDFISENRFGHLIWDRENGDCVDMTLEEICKALGKNVRIVKEK